MIKKYIGIIKEDPRIVFFILCMSCLGMYIVLNAMFGSEVMKWMVQQNNLDIRFIDYFMHVHYTKNPAELYSSMWNDTQGCFPALSYIMYRLFYRLVMVEGYEPPKRGDTESMSGAYLVYIYYTLVVVTLIFTAISLYNKNRAIGKNVLLFACIMTSCPFMGSGFMVGNSTMLVLGLLMMFMALRDSESKVLREVALFFLAIAAGFKIYPAVFGLLYLKEKRWKEAIRLTLYGIILFAVPFAFFGGLEGVKLWLGHIKGTMGMLEYGRVEYVKGVIYTALIDAGVSDGSATVGVICSVVPTLFLFSMIALAAVSKNKYRTVLFLVAAITFYPTNAFRYTLTYFSLPLVMWLQEEKDKAFAWGKCESWIVSILNGMIFSIPVILWGLNAKFKLFLREGMTSTSVDVWIYSMAYLLLFVEVFFQIKTASKEKC